MAVFQNKSVDVAQAYSLYLKKYLDTATNGNVSNEFHFNSLSASNPWQDQFVRFKCKYCKDNLCQKMSTFDQNGYVVPWELQEWVKKHRHDPKQETLNIAPGKIIAVADVENIGIKVGTVICSECKAVVAGGGKFCANCGVELGKTKPKSLEQTQGRKFR